MLEQYCHNALGKRLSVIEHDSHVERPLAMLKKTTKVHSIFFHRSLFRQLTAEMAASELKWAPDTLYNTAIKTIVSFYPSFKEEIKTFPDNVLFDVVYKVCV